MASTTILSFTDLSGDAQKIASVSVSKIRDVTTHRIINGFLPTKQYEASDSLVTLKTESGVFFSATEDGFSILLNSLLVQRLAANGSGCDIFLQGGEKISVSESITVIEARIDATAPSASSAIYPIENTATGEELDESNYYRTTASGTWTLIAASGVYNAAEPFIIKVKNVSGGNITISRTGSDTIYTSTSGSTSVIMADGDFYSFVCSSTSTYDLI